MATDPLRISEEEHVALIEQAVDGKYLQLRFSANWVALLDTAQNQWALRYVAERRQNERENKLVRDGRDHEREQIACWLEAEGHHELASQVFAGMTRPINEALRNNAIDTYQRRSKK